MSWATYRDWLAVVEVYELKERMNFQNDLGFARGFDRRGASEAGRLRRLMRERIRDLMLEHAGEESRSARIWDALRQGAF